ncbi:MAG: methyltransferase domain-containing protein [Planctomycetales bacterium]|nr:methyltransferase domain-containing protein [Planctomycetales bacterium]
MEILCVGRTLIDVVVYGPTQPPPRHSARIADMIRLEAGGGALHCAKAFRLLGHVPTAVGYAGNDIEGWLLDQLLLKPTFRTNIQRSTSQPTQVNIVYVDELGRVRYLMQREEPSSSHSLSLPPASEVTADAVHISTINQLVAGSDHPILTWLDELREIHPHLIVSADSSKLVKYFSQNVHLLEGRLDFLFGSRAELQLLSNYITRRSPERETDIYDVVRSIGKEIACGCVVSTLSSQGSIALVPDGDIIESRGFHVEKPKNANGAGDTFCAAFLHARLELEKPIEESLDFANYLAARHVEGSLDSYDPTESLDEMYKHRRSVTVPAAEPAYYAKAQEAYGYGKRFDRTREIEPRVLDRWLERIRDFGRLNESSKVLDAGCGTGRFGIPVAKASGCKVVGVDLSREMIRVASDKTDAIGDSFSHKPLWLIGDLADLSELLPERMGTFDCVILSSVISQLGERLPEVLEQLHAALQDTGRLVMRVRCRELIDHVWWYDYFPRAKSAALEKFMPLARIVSFVCNAGFDIVHLEKVIDKQFSMREELIDKLKAGGFSWCDLYAEKELGEILSRIARSEKRRLHVCNPCYFVVAEKHRSREKSI